MVSERVRLIDGEMEELFYVASKAACFLGIDSCMRLLGLSNGLATFFCSPFCDAVGQAPVSQICRWYPFHAGVLPNHLDVQQISKMINNVIQNPIAAMFPNIDNLERIVLDRKLLK